ncbi:phage portal protein [Helicobacter salomonis]|uniref:phage portal protein n=1 Tax=Helicobacter salomonis TaxID=56878 RepID=UPI000CF05185|nr:phage portal protein [Helicobacter salomonis]
MGWFNFFKKSPPKPKIRRFYAQPPSLDPSELEKQELFRLLSNTEVDAYFAPLRAQARSISLSSPLVAGFFDTLDKEIYGDNGIALDMASDDARLNTQIEKAWLAWRSDIPFSSLDFWEIESLVLLHLKRDGEAFVYYHESPLGLSVNVIDPINVDENQDDGKSLKKGVRVDNHNQPTHYCVRDENDQIQEISADCILHIFKRHNALQTRGVSALAPVIHPVFQKDRFKSAELKRARLQSEITGFFVPNEQEDLPDIPGLYDSKEEEKPQTTIQERAEVGKMTYIDKNLKPYFTESHNATNIEFFIKQTDKEIAKALGVSYSTLTGDLSEVNYSSIRHGASEQRRQFRGLQNFIIRHLHKKIFKAWVKNELMRENIPLDCHDKILNNFAFKPQGWEYVDPLKEMNANKVALESGQKSLSQILREQGKELDTHIAELQKEQTIYDILKARKKS